MQQQQKQGTKPEIIKTELADIIRNEQATIIQPKEWLMQALGISIEGKNSHVVKPLKLKQQRGKGYQ